MGTDESFPVLIRGMVDQIVIQLGVRILPDRDFQTGVRCFALEPGLQDDTAFFPVRSQLFSCFSDPGKQIGMAGEIVRCEDDKLGIRDFDGARAGSQGLRCIRSSAGAAQQRQQQDRYPENFTHKSTTFQRGFIPGDRPDRQDTTVPA